MINNQEMNLVQFRQHQIADRFNMASYSDVVRVAAAATARPGWPEDRKLCEYLTDVSELSNALRALCHKTEEWKEITRMHDEGDLVSLEILAIQKQKVRGEDLTAYLHDAEEVREMNCTSTYASDYLYKEWRDKMAVLQEKRTAFPVFRYMEDAEWEVRFEVEKWVGGPGETRPTGARRRMNELLLLMGQEPRVI